MAWVRACPALSGVPGTPFPATTCHLAMSQLQRYADVLYLLGREDTDIFERGKRGKDGEDAGALTSGVCAGGRGRGGGAPSECGMCMCVLVTGAEGKEQLAGLGEAWLPLKELPHSSGPDNLEPSLILEMITQ